MIALEDANHVRLFRGQLKKDIKNRKIKVRQLLLEPPREIEGMEIETLLLAIPRMGSRRVNDLLSSFYVSPIRKIRDLTERQRKELARETQRM